MSTDDRNYICMREAMTDLIGSNENFGTQRNLFKDFKSTLG